MKKNITANVIKLSIHIPSNKSDLSGFMNTNLAKKNTIFLYNPYKKTNIGRHSIAPINIIIGLESIEAIFIVIFNSLIPPYYSYNNIIRINQILSKLDNIKI